MQAGWSVKTRPARFAWTPCEALTLHEVAHRWTLEPACAAPTHHELAEPRVQPFQIEGEIQWRAALASAQLSRPERGGALEVLGVPWLSPELVATEAARERLLRWVAAGRPADSAERVILAGDADLTFLALRAFERRPPPVLDHLRRNATMLSVGMVCVGFCSTLPAAWADASEARRLLACAYRTTADGFLATVGHECAHHWLCAAPSEDLPAQTGEGRAEAVADRRALLACALEWGRLSYLTDTAEESERQACRLARSWGFTGAEHSDGARCAAHARDRITREAAVLPPLEDL